MYTTENAKEIIMTCADYHVSAAEHHEDAAESHRNAAVYYACGNYQEAYEQAQLAKDCGDLALQNSEKAMR
jgi:hypothetical protein